MSKLRVLFIGPFPPPLGGAIVESMNLWDFLDQHAEISITKLRTNDSIVGVVKSPFKFLSLIFRVDTVFVYGSHRGISRLSALLIPVCRLFGKRCVVKITGGNLWEYYRDSHPVWKSVLHKTLLSRCLLLLETNYLIDNFKNEATNLQWFPMTRRMNDVSTSKEQLLQPETNKTTVLKVAYFGHIRIEKGLLQLIEASDRVKNVDIDAYGEFIDLDESVFRNGRVTYRGVVQPHEVVETMRSYDVMALPSFYPGEGYPGVLIEAKSAGLAVVSTQWRSIPEIIEHNQTGLLVEPKNVDELVDAFHTLQRDTELLDRIKRNSAQSFQDYDINDWGEVLVKYLRSG